MTDDGEQPRPATSAFAPILAWVAVGALPSIGAIVATRRFLYADSSLLLVGLWGNASFAIAHPSRWFGMVVTQWIPVIAMKLGYRDPSGIATLYGLNLWLNPILFVALIWWFSGRSREITLAALLCVLFFFQTTYMVIDSEASVVFWLAALLSLATLRRGFSPWALLLFVPLAFTHDSVVLLIAPVLLVLLVARRGAEAFYGPMRWRALVAVNASVLALAAWRASRPSVAGLRTQFVEAAVSLPASPSLVLTCLVFGALVAPALRPRLRRISRLFWPLVLALTVLPFALPELIWPFYHFRARVLNAAVALLWLAYLHGRARGRLGAPRIAVARVVALAGVVFLFQGKITYEWSRHLTLFRAELEQDSGVIPFPGDGALAEPRSRQFTWSWATPTRSVVFQGMQGGTVRTLMLNADTTLWQPFHPLRPATLPDLSGVGVRYGTDLLRRPPGG